MHSYIDFSNNISYFVSQNILFILAIFILLFLPNLNYYYISQGLFFIFVSFKVNFLTPEIFIVGTILITLLSILFVFQLLKSKNLFKLLFLILFLILIYKQLLLLYAFQSIFEKDQYEKNPIICDEMIASLREYNKVEGYISEKSDFKLYIERNCY